MSAETFKILNLQEKDLDRSNVPQVVGAEGTSLGAIGRIECELKIGKETCKQKFFGVSKFKKTFDTGSRLCKNVCSRCTLDKTQFVCINY